MADELQNPNPPPSDGAPSTPQPEPRRSLREVAEAAWDEVEAGADDDGGSDEAGEEVDASGVRRDARGRFAPKGEEPGEAAAPAPPSPETEVSGTQSPEGRTQPPPPGSSSEAPANWSAADRAMFAKLPQEGRDFLTRRHSEMEGDYQRRVQTYGAAAQFAEALAPVFTDPVIMGSLQQAGMTPQDAIHQWGGFHRRAMDPDPNVRMGLLNDLAQRMGLNPAAGGQPSPPPGLSAEDMQDPAIRFFADQLAQAQNGQAQLRNELHSIRQREQEAVQAQTLRVTKWGIDNFADERGPDGKPLRPYFDAVLPQVIELFRANPSRDLNEAYQTAVWMNPQIRAQVQQAEAARASQVTANQRAAQAAKLNTRGRTGPVSGKPNGAGDRPLTLRETIEATADEVGF